MDVSHPTHRCLSKITFGLQTPEQVRKLSVKQINNPVIFDSLNHPVPGGLYDPALGPIDKQAKCSTCGLNSFQCPGHFGHIELTLPVYAPMLFGQMWSLLKMTCFYCHRLRLPRVKVYMMQVKLQLLDHGLLVEAMEVEHVALASDDQQAEEEHHSNHDEHAIIAKLKAHLDRSLQAQPLEKQRVASVGEYRRQVIHEFFKRVGSSQVCPHCRGHTPSLHRSANTKIFQMPLRRSHQSAMDAKGFSTDTLFKGGEETPADEDPPSEIEEDADEQKISKRGMKYLTPMHIFEHLAALWANESAVLEAIFGSIPTTNRQRSNAQPAPDHRIFFTQVIAVPPSRFRPPSIFGDSQFDHPQNTYLSEILRLNQRIVELHAEDRQVNTGDKKEAVLPSTESPTFARLMQTWIQLQEQVNYFFDSSKNTQVAMGKIPPAGIKQILEKKEGLFRKHMMGKRVNYAARSVISPDVMLETCEVGVPMVFARKLTYPEPVTQWNLEEMREAVMNGPEKHPGASHVQMEDGTLVALEHLNTEARAQLANQLLSVDKRNLSDPVDASLAGKKVMRHIRTGDICLMNRQPTLHKPSIMAHRVRVLPNEKTLRMHYANCNTYNADFDGDEMNLHVPQNPLARAEAYEIANTDNQYLVPTDGSPLRGLIQDHVVTGVILCLKSTMLNRDTFQQLLYGSLPESIPRILTPAPAIIRPKPLWTGKQLITAVLMNLTAGQPALNIRCEGKIKRELWGRDHADETEVILKDGYLCTGVMDKAQFGASAYGITHATYELYGPTLAGQLLSTMSRLYSKYDQHYGFTCRMDDLLLTPEAEAARAKLIRASRLVGRKVVGEYAEVPLNDETDPEAIDRDLSEGLERIIRSDELSRGLDGAFKQAMNAVTSDIIKACLPAGQYRLFPLNNMSLMTLSGAKGSVVNFSQIAGLLGQQELEGRRVPCMVSGKTLPSFPAYDTRPRAGGYISQRFFSGIRPQEFFFHCMAGREGLIDTAVKTSRSGYLQRCLIKHLEGLKISYDQTVRDTDGSLIQFLYGEDGLDVTRQRYLRKHAFCAENYAACLAQAQPTLALDLLDTESAVKAARRALRNPNKYEPVLALHSPAYCLGATSEKFAQELEQFIEGSKMVGDDGKSGKIAEKQFRALGWLRYMRSLAQPGEAVGLLAAQSIGEPSTQMTLNTFHFAGFGAKNVTLGIPRLREIIMTASQRIKTPTMTIAMRLEHAEEATKLAARLSKLTLRQILETVTVQERLVSATHLNNGAAVNLGRRARVYTITLQLLPLNETEAQHGVQVGEIKQAMENAFITRLMAQLERTLKRMKAVNRIEDVISTKKVTLESSNANSESKAADDDGGEEESGGRRQRKKDFADADDDDEVGADDMDADEARQSARRKQMATYEEEEEEQEAENSEAEEATVQEEEEPEAPAEKSTLAECRNIRNYSFDRRHARVSLDLVMPASTPKLLMLDLVESMVGDVVIRQVSGINKAHAQVDRDGQGRPTAASISTEGVNLTGLWPWQHLLDLTTLCSNDIGAILHTYGVEAARATIVREIAAVFNVYGISVDPRHLSLIADYMTQDGGYRPFNRMGIDAAASPLLKMTFETTVNFLRTAALYGESDDLLNPSARLVMGMPVGVGTGSFELRSQ